MVLLMLNVQPKQVYRGRKQIRDCHTQRVGKWGTPDHHKQQKKTKQQNIKLAMNFLWTLDVKGNGIKSLNS